MRARAGRVDAGRGPRHAAPRPGRRASASCHVAGRGLGGRGARRLGRRHSPAGARGSHCRPMPFSARATGWARRKRTRSKPSSTRARHAVTTATLRASASARPHAMRRYPASRTAAPGDRRPRPRDALAEILGALRWHGGWPRRPWPSASASCSRPCVPRRRSCSGTTAVAVESRQNLQGARVRLAGAVEIAQPAAARTRLRLAHGAPVRSPHAGRAGRPPAGRAHRRRARPRPRAPRAGAAGPALGARRRADRDRGNGLPLSPAGSRSPEGLWELVAAGATRSGSSPPTVAGTWSACMTPIRTRTGTSYVARRRLPLRRRRVRRRVLRHRPARGAGDGSPAAAAAGSAPGRRSKTPASTRRRCAAAGPACSWASMITDYGAASDRLRGRGLEGYALTGNAASVASGRVAYALRPGGSRADGRHGLLVVAGRAAPGVPGAAPRRVRAGAGRRCDGDGHAGHVRRVQRASAGLRPTGAASRSRDAADGTGWSEGVGVLVLERLSDARASAIRCSRSCAAARSTRTALATG